MKFRNLFAAGTAAVMLLSNAVIFSGTVSAEGTMTAKDITQNMTIGWNIGNSLDATGAGLSYHETSWGNPKITQELINTVKAKGFNTIRIPTTWYPEVTTSTDENGNPVYTIKEEWLARVKEVVDYAYQQDMYVILNIHHEEWINRSDFPTAYDEMSERLKQMWTQIATYFKDYDQHLIFEGMNEPRQIGTSYEWQGNAECYEVVNKLDADFVNTVRSIDSPYQDTRLLMIPLTRLLHMQARTLLWLCRMMTMLPFHSTPILRMILQWVTEITPLFPTRTRVIWIRCSQISSTISQTKIFPLLWANSAHQTSITQKQDATGQPITSPGQRNWAFPASCGTTTPLPIPFPLRRHTVTLTAATTLGMRLLNRL